MSHQLDVQVLDEVADPVVGVRVRVDIAGIWSGGTLEERTDEDGHASFETAGDYESYRKLRIYVRGQSFGPYDIGDGAFTVQL